MLVACGNRNCCWVKLELVCSWCYCLVVQKQLLGQAEAGLQMLVACGNRNCCWVKLELVCS